MTPVIIPHRQLPAGTLQAMLEEFVTREGNDPAERENPTQAHVEQLIRRLDSGRFVIVYDTDAESFTLMARDQAESLFPELMA
jgi:uncharacterized protein YheU (UPF0270 family)